tara:strand:- start:256 stop:846 length:591 start_codon:yes stop_codon:yes gene_type:complete
MQKLEAPIAGANYAADTRNYPWHRPPDITEYDEGVDYLITKMQEAEELELVYALLNIDSTVVTVVASVLMQGVARGKFSIDLAILMAGPIARYVGILADEAEIKYDMGVSDANRIKITPTTLKMALGIVDTNDEALPLEEPEVLPEQPQKSGGLMGRPAGEEIVSANADEQAAMLGNIDEPEMADVIEEEVADELA